MAVLALSWFGAGAPVDARQLLVAGLTATGETYVPPEKAHTIKRFEAELACALARTQGFDVALRMAPLDELLTALANGTIDFIPALSRTPERQGYLDYSVAHSRLNTNLFVRRGEVRVQRIEDIPGARVLVVKSGFSQDWAERKGWGDSLVLAGDVTEAVRRLSAGEADAVLATQFNAFQAMRELGIRNVQVASAPVAELQRDHAIAVRRGNRELLALLNDGLFTLKQTGEMDVLRDRWLDVMETDIISFQRAVRYGGGLLLAIVALGGGAWMMYRAQVKRAFRRMAEIERRVVERTEELASAKAHIEAVVANTPAGILLMDPHDAAVPCRILECNDFTCRLHGYTKTELIGTSFNRLRAHPYDAAALEIIVADLRLQPRRHGQSRHIHKNGAILEIEFHTTLITLAGRELLLTIDIDITERVRAEAALRRTEEFQRLVLEASNDGIFDWDMAHDRFHVSPRGRQMLGLAEGDLPPQRAGWWQRLHPDDAPEAEAALWRNVTAGTPYVHTARFLHQDGSVRWLYCRAHALRDAQGHPVRMIGSYTDITDLKRIDEELQLSRRLRAMGELVGGIAHEFNNLLTPILLQSSLMTELEGTTSEMAQQIQPVIDAAQRAQALTQRLLQFGRRRTAGVESQSLWAVIESTVSLVRSTVDRRIEIETHVEPGLLPVRLNSATMGQAAMNLILNARDALLDKLESSPPAHWRPCIEIVLEQYIGPARAVGAKPADRGLRRWQRLTVRDNGPGMTADLQERVFEPFFTTKSIGQGTGLGLPMVWSTAAELGGWVDVVSMPGEGATFHVYLPEDEMAPAAPTPRALVAASSHPVVRRRILLVEDDALVGESTVRLLKHFGHEVVWARHGEEALVRLSQQDEVWDVMMTDLNMPGIGGEDLVERVRARGFAGKIVVVSGHVTRQAEMRLHAAGVEAILTKPFDVPRFKTFLADLWPDERVAANWRASS